MSDETRYAVIYARSATENPAGIQAQISECKDRADGAGLQVEKIFQDTGSGVKGDRPGLQSMMDFLKSRQGQKMVVITAGLSRIARCDDLSRKIRAEFANRNAACWYVNAPIDQQNLID